jgi:hypothetical protein
MRTRRWFTVFALLGLVLSTGCCCPCHFGERWRERRACRQSCKASACTPCDCNGQMTPGPYITPTPMSSPLPKPVPTIGLSH